VFDGSSALLRYLARGRGWGERWGDAGNVPFRSRVCWSSRR